MEKRSLRYDIHEYRRVADAGKSGREDRWCGKNEFPLRKIREVNMRSENFGDEHQNSEQCAECEKLKHTKNLKCALLNGSSWSTVIK